MDFDVSVYIIVLLVIDIIIVAVYHVYSRYVISVAPLVYDIDAFCTNLSVMGPYLIHSTKLMSRGYAAYSIVVRNDGVNKYIGIDGLPSKMPIRYVKVVKEYRKRVDELVKYVDSVTF